MVADFVLSCPDEDFTAALLGTEKVEREQRSREESYLVYVARGTKGWDLMDGKDEEGGWAETWPPVT